MNASLSLVERLRGSDGLCPFCGRDPYHYVDIGVGFQAAAVVCCDKGIGYFQHHHEDVEAEMQLRQEAAARIEALERCREALSNLLSFELLAKWTPDRKGNFPEAIAEAKAALASSVLAESLEEDKVK